MSRMKVSVLILWDGVYIASAAFCTTDVSTWRYGGFWERRSPSCYDGTAFNKWLLRPMHRAATDCFCIALLGSVALVRCKMRMLLLVFNECSFLMAK